MNDDATELEIDKGKERGPETTNDPVLFMQKFEESEYFKEDILTYYDRNPQPNLDKDQKRTQFLNSKRARATLDDFFSQKLRLVFDIQSDFYSKETISAIIEYEAILRDRHKNFIDERGSERESLSGEVVFLDNSQRESHMRAAELLSKDFNDKGINVPELFCRQLIRKLIRARSS